MPLNGVVAYTEFAPDIRLQPYIYCYWHLRSIGPLSAFYDHRVVADGCIDIFVDISNPCDSLVMGFADTFTLFPLSGPFHYIGIRFLPTMFPHLFNVNAKELTNNVTPLADVHPPTAGFFKDILHTDVGQDELHPLLNDHFLRLTAQTKAQWDGRLYHAVNTILQKAGGISVGSDLNTGISERQLRRLFEFHIGDTAKSFSNIVRFQNALRTSPSARSIVPFQDLHGTGYYDQSHFIKAFRQYYGTTPGDASGS